MHAQSQPTGLATASGCFSLGLNPCRPVCAAGQDYLVSIVDSDFLNVALPMSVVNSFSVTPSGTAPSPAPGPGPSTAPPVPGPSHAPPPPSSALRLGAGHSLLVAGAALMSAVLLAF